MEKSNDYLSCPACDILLRESVFVCPKCGTDIQFAIETKRQLRSSLRILSAALIGAVILSAIVLFAFGIVQQYPKLVVPLWIA